MWRLTITQKRKSEYSDHLVSESVFFENKDLYALVAIVTGVQESSVLETEYTIRNIEEGGAEV